MSDKCFTVPRGRPYALWDAAERFAICRRIESYRGYMDAPRAMGKVPKGVESSEEHCLSTDSSKILRQLFSRSVEGSNSR